MGIGVLILNRNGKRWLSLLYESLREQGYRGVGVYLVDNASEDGSVEMTLKDYPEVKIIRMPQNLGYCMAYNLAMPYAFADGCEWVIWANNDIRIDPNCLTELVRIAQSEPMIGVLGPAFMGWDSNEPNYYMVGNHPYAIDAMMSKSPVPIDVEWVEGSFLMVSRLCSESVGPLDPHLKFYWEEADFCRRARYQGWRVVLVPNALARHFGGGSVNQGDGYVFNSFRERNYYIYKLTNPFQGFGKNLRDAMHLFLVNLKVNYKEFPESSLIQIRVFGEVIRGILRIYKKWAREKSGGRPSITTEEFQWIRAEVIQRRI